MLLVGYIAEHIVHFVHDTALTSGGGKLLRDGIERGLVGKYPTKWTDLARKHGTLPSILDTGTNFSRKAAPHLASFIDVL